MKDPLTPQERKVLSCMQMDWRLDVPELAKLTGLRSHVVSYALRKLKERKLSRRFVMYNIHALGLTDYCIFFNVHGTGKRIRDSVISYAVESAQTTYVAELSGRYQYTASIMATSIFEVESFFDGLAARLKQPAIDLSFGIRAQWSIFPVKYLDPIAKKVPHLTRTQSKSFATVDSVDTRLLALLSSKPDISWTQLAASVGIPYSTVRYRIDSLVQRGIIIGFPHAVDGARLGKHPFRILVVARGLNPSLRRDLFAFATSHRLCTMFVRCVGAWDFEFNYDLDELAQGGEVIQELYDTFGDFIQSTTTVTELSVLKAHEWPAQAIERARSLLTPAK
jgi:DNA-binding Lrp family transcriptional regulator